MRRRTWQSRRTTRSARLRAGHDAAGNLGCDSDSHCRFRRYQVDDEQTCRRRGRVRADECLRQHVASLAALALRHEFALTGLRPNTIYHFRVRSADAAGNLSISTDQTFLTLPFGGGAVSALRLFPPCVTSPARSGIRD